MAEGAGQAELHAHAAREVLDALLDGEVEGVGEPGEAVGVPAVVGVRVDRAHVAHAQVAGQRDRVEDHADALLGVRPLRAGEQLAGRAEHARRAAVGCDEAEKGLDGGGLAGPVLADEAHDLALADVKVDALQGEALVVLGKPVRADERRVGGGV